MDPKLRQYLLMGLALSPAAAAIFLPASAAKLPFVLGLIGAGSAYALLSSLRMHAGEAEFARSGTPLVRGAVLRDPSADLPDLPTMRRHIAACVTLPEPPDRPPSQDEAIAKALRHVLKSWDCLSPGALNRDEVTELYLLDRLLRAAPAEAGRLSQAFLRPDIVLELRDETAALAQCRSDYDTQQKLFFATYALWDSAAPARVRGMLSVLEQLPKPDIDLWHHVVLDHDPRDPMQRAAALWCLRQKDCDRATIAAYLSFVAAEDRLQAAARAGDQVYLDAVRGVIDAWNAGFYRRQGLALSPTDAVAADAPRFAEALDDLAGLTGTPRWPDPQGLFTSYRGRRPRRRDHWCLKTGTLRQAPKPAHYALSPVRQAA